LSSPGVGTLQNNYRYGQLPNPPIPGSHDTQHPIPGSFNRQNFNPQTQSFVPGTFPANQPQAFRGSPQRQAGVVQPGSSPASFNLSRQASNNSLPANYSSHAPQMNVGNYQAPANNNNKGRPYSTSPHTWQPPSGASSLSKWGTPAHLPPKPPPPANLSPAANSQPTARPQGYAAAARASVGTNGNVIANIPIRSGPAQPLQNGNSTQHTGA
jgi:hypothetical protein